MRTVRSAAMLLEAAATSRTLAPIASAIIGGAPLPEPLAREGADRLGLPRTIETPLILRGTGTLRALVAESTEGAPLRDVVSRIAGRLAQRSPHLLWLLAITERGGSHVAIAAWSADRTPPRIAALVADRSRVVDSDAETLRALASAGSSVDVLAHLRWIDLLGRDALTRRFYRTLERVVESLGAGASGKASGEERAELALLCMSRLLFLAFLEAKGWLDGDRGFLARKFDETAGGAGGFDRRVLRVLFFGTLNTPIRARAPASRKLGRIPFLNGGLFSRTALERRVRDFQFRDEDLGAVFSDLLSRYRFTAREDSTAWSEAAIDPEMLGKAFESLMASRARRETGAFYTPQSMVAHVTRAALRDVLGGDVGELLAEDETARAGGVISSGAEDDPALVAHARSRIGELRVLDPACGSGAFLVQVLEQLAALSIRCGNDRPLAAVRRDVLTRSIFGVDVNPTAVWLCELRLWLSVVIESEHEDPMCVPPLPNLDHHIRVGDALGGEAFQEVSGSSVAFNSGHRAGKRIEHLRARYARATGRRKDTLAKSLEREERAAALLTIEAELAQCAHDRRDLISAIRSRDLFGGRTEPAAGDRATLDTLRRKARALRTRRAALASGGSLPFTFAAHFADAAASGGFDLVVGNPPWVRLHNIPASTRQMLRQRFRVFREAAWASGAAGAHAGVGFAGQVDMAALFLERSLSLVRPSATVALLVPSKLWRSLAGGGVRRMLFCDARLVAIEDWSEGPSAFDAAVYPSLVVARRSAPEAPSCVRAATHRRGRLIGWSVNRDRLALDTSPGSPWLIAPGDVRAGFDRLTSTGIPMASSVVGRPLLGVKSGLNAAFLVELEGRDAATSVTDADRAAAQYDGDIVRIRAGERSGQVECWMLRPLVRGEDIAAWRVQPGSNAIVWTHGDDGAPLSALPEHAARWLAPWRRSLLARADSRTARRWWSLYRTDAASSAMHRVVWSDFGRVPRAAVIPAGSVLVPLNSCYVARCPTPDDALALSALINGPLAAAWLSLIAEPARGGYHRYLGWTMALLPLPRDWERARALLSPLAERAMSGTPPSDAELLEGSIRAYRVRPADVAPLLGWAAR